MKAIVIDDEPKARKLMQTLLLEDCNQITDCKTAEDLETGVALIKETSPDLVFLDIEMPRHTGLEIIDFFEGEKMEFQIIFVTAYNKYAIEAFKSNAIDYLLKPVDLEELKVAIAKGQEKIQQFSIAQNLQALKSSFKQLARNKIALKVPSGIIFIEHTDILYLKADGMYTTLFLQSGKQELIAKPVKHFEDQLSHNFNFYRPHRSYLVNINSIKEFTKKEGGHLVMSNGDLVPISKEKREEFYSLIAKNF